MSILIVDAFGKGCEERRLFAEFKGAVMRAIEPLQLEIGGIRLLHETMHSLGQYVYKPADPRTGSSAVRNFDTLDMIFIGAQADLCPWGDETRDLFTLVKMCHITKKCVFGCSAMAHFLAFCCATNGIHIVPLNGPTGSSMDLFNADAQARRVRAASRDVVLDNTTGDIYRLDRAEGLWVPYTNAGILLRADRIDACTKQVFRSAPWHANQLLLKKSNELACRVVPRAASHWLFRGVRGSEFAVRNRPCWSISAAACLRSGSPFHVLAESTRAPLVVKSHNFVAVHFDLSSEYPETETMVRNFVLSCFAKMRHHGYIDQTSRLYMTFHSQTEDALHETDDTAPGSTSLRSHSCPATLEDAARPSNSPVARPRSAEPAITARQRVNARKQRSTPEQAYAHECMFLRNTRSEYRLVRSHDKWAKKREEWAPQATTKRKSNFWENADSLDNPNAQAFGQSRRINAARSKRNAKVRFQMAAGPQPKPDLRKVRASSCQELSMAAHKRVPNTPIYERFDPVEVVKQTLAINSVVRTPTHHLRKYRTGAARAESRSDTRVREALHGRTSKRMLATAFDTRKTPDRPMSACGLRDTLAVPRGDSNAQARRRQHCKSSDTLNKGGTNSSVLPRGDTTAVAGGSSSGSSNNSDSNDKQSMGGDASRRAGRGARLPRPGSAPPRQRAIALTSG